MCDIHFLWATFEPFPGGTHERTDRCVEKSPREELLTMKRVTMGSKASIFFCLLLTRIGEFGCGACLAQEIKEQAILRGHTHDVSSIQFTNDGSALVSGSYDSTVKVWDVRTGRASLTLGEHRNSILAVALTRDGKTLASGSWDESIKLWNLTTGKERVTLNGIKNPVYALAFSPHGKTLASGSWGSERGKLVGRVRLWDVGTGKPTVTLPEQSREVAALTFSGDGKILAFGSGEEVRLWQVIKGKEIGILKGHTQIVRSLSFSPDGRTLVSGSGDFEVKSPTRAEIKVWDVARGIERADLKGPFAPAWVAIDPHGKTVASAGLDFPSILRFWDLATLKELGTVEIRSRVVNCLAFAPDGRTLACGCADGTIRLWDISKLSEKAGK
jgi:WD40 repeat protein